MASSRRAFIVGGIASAGLSALAYTSAFGQEPRPKPGDEPIAAPAEPAPPEPTPVEPPPVEPPASPPEGLPFDFDVLKVTAKRLADAPFQPPAAALPGPISNLGYDEFRGIRFRPDQALWQDAPFEAHFFHRGFLFKDRILINEIVDGKARPIAYDAALYTKDDREMPSLPTDTGFAGFRLHTALNRPDIRDELVSFLGASYFRALGRNQVYGLSARGLAIDTAEQEGEEFPLFREFWIVRPAPGEERATVYALLDSRSVTGAYKFVIDPGATTTVDVDMTLFARTDIKKLGIAPLTSMYDFGENDRLGIDDYRGEVHDSDGLSLQTGTGEWIWRPLVNPQRLRVSSFMDVAPRGFGLMQRDRSFASYLDAEAHYERRPSAWVEPKDDWGRGYVQLVEIPAPNEYNDNIVAYWVPEAKLAAGDTRSFAYRLHWCVEPPVGPDAAIVTATHVGAAGIAGQKAPGRKFAVTFSGGLLSNLPETTEAQVEVSTNGSLREPPILQKLPSGNWRAVFDINPAPDRATEIRCFLKFADSALTETWSYQWTP